MIEKYNKGLFGKDPVKASCRFAAGMIFKKYYTILESSKKSPEIYTQAKLKIDKAEEVLSKDEFDLVKKMFFLELKTKEILLDKGENFEKKNVRRLYRDVKKILDRLAEAYKIYGSDKS